MAVRHGTFTTPIGASVTRRRGGAVRRWLARLAFVGAAALAVAGAALYLTLPDVTTLKTRNPPTTAFMALREREYREAKGKVPPRRQTWVPLRRVSPHLVNAVLLAEDAAFYQHDGVDYHELWESLKLDWREKRLSRGASTITQQLAKNLYLSPSRSPVRKFRELLIARRLEATLEKRRILEIYLNVIEWGRNIYGVEAAARAYFDAPARDLTPAQSAQLAGMLINPIRYSPLAPSRRLTRRQHIILKRMARFGRISPQEYRIALGLDVVAPPPSPEPPPELSPEVPADDLDAVESAPEPPVFAPPPLEPAEPAIEPAPPDEPELSTDRSPDAASSVIQPPAIR